MTDDSLVNAAREHVALFNACVDSRDWGPFVATYHDDAILEMVGSGLPALRGRAAMADFYRTRPPREHMHVDTITVTGEGATEVGFAWDSGGRARLAARWQREAQGGWSVVHVRLTPLSRPGTAPGQER